VPLELEVKENNKPYFKGGGTRFLEDRQI